MKGIVQRADEIGERTEAIRAQTRTTTQTANAADAVAAITTVGDIGDHAIMASVRETGFPLTRVSLGCLKLLKTYSQKLKAILQNHAK